MRVLVPIADNSEEIETSCITDTLVRAGAEVTVASCNAGDGLQCKMARGLKVVADCKIEACADGEWDAIVLPGGMPGAEHLRDSAPLKALLLRQHERSACLAAVCASPAVVFAAHGLLPDSWTCFPVDKFKGAAPGWQDARVVADGHRITSQGPGTSLAFALRVVEQLYGKEKADTVGAALLTATGA